MTVRSGGGHCLQLEYPKGLSPSERVDAEKRLSPIPPELSQQLLDELAAHLKAGTIRVSPLVYLVGLIKRADAGEFVSEAALRIADARERRRRHEAVLHRLEILNKEVILKQAAADSSPLVHRLDEIRKRARGRGET